MRRHCPNCGKEERSQTNDSFFCKTCGVLMDPNDPNNPLYPSIATKKTTPKELVKKLKEAFVMNTKKIKTWPWKSIGYALSILSFTVIFVVFFKIFVLSWPGLVALCGLGALIIGTSILFLDETKENFSTEATKTGLWFVCIGIVAIVIFLIFGHFIPKYSLSSTSNIAATTTDKTSTTVAPDYYVGVPANAKDINNGVWNQPYADAVMVGTDETTAIYTQSGKDNSSELSGLLPVNVALVIDSYNLTVNGKSYTNGNLLVIVNDSDAEKDIANYGISYTNGAAQLISVSNLQKLLDSNIAVKFSRGDWSKEKNQWSYSPWALNNLWIPEGYTYTPLKLDYESDTYPNRDLATDTSVNTSGATTK